MREALTVVGFLLILAFVAIFAAPLYVDWNQWRDTIAARLSEHLGTIVRIEGPVEAHLLPQPWLSLRNVTVGVAGSGTVLRLEGVEGDVDLAALIRGDVELANLVLDTPTLTVEAAPDGRIAPLSSGTVTTRGAIDSFEVQGGTLHYVDAKAGEDVTIDGIRLVGEARSLTGPFKAEGGLRLGGVPHTLKIATGTGDGSDVRLKASIVPADRPLTLDVDGSLKLVDGRPLFDGLATLARPPVNTRGDRAPPEEPWSVAARMKLTPSSMVADSVAIQVGPDERALKLTGSGSALIGRETRVDAMLSATQLELDRLAGVKPDRRLPPAQVLAKVLQSYPSLSGLPVTARLGLSAEGIMLGGELMQDVKAEIATVGQGWSVSHFEADLPGQSRLVLAGDVAGDEAGGSSFDGTMSLASRRASALIAWMQADDRPSAPNAARRLDLGAHVRVQRDALALTGLKLAIDNATVEGRLAWTRIAPESDAGRIEADLKAERLDLDALPAAAALVPGGLAAIGEADIRLSAQALAFAGIEARSASGRVRVGGRLVALEDVTVEDLGGASLTANGRIDQLGVHPQGEIRVAVNGRDLTGLATALRRSPLPPEAIDAFTSRAPALSPASADIVVSFGDIRRLTLDGKLGGTVTQFTADITGPADRPNVEARLKGDSLDGAALLRQLGLKPVAAAAPGRASLELGLSGPLDGSRRWSAAFEGAGLSVAGSGKATGALARLGIDGRLTLRAQDALTPAQLFGVALPGAQPGEGVEIDTGFRYAGKSLALDDLTGVALGMPVSGRLTVDPGRPARIGGALTFQTLDAARLASLLAGTDLSAPQASAAPSPWPAAAFGPNLLAGLAGTVELKARELVLSPRLPHATEAKATLAFDDVGSTVDGLSAGLAGGTLAGELKLSRSALDTALTGRLTLSDVTLRSQPITGRLDLAADLQGTGRTARALVGSLTGGGTLALRNPRFEALAPNAFDALVAAVDQGMKPEAAAVAQKFGHALIAAPLDTEDLAGSLSLAGGVLRLATASTRAGTSGLSVSGSLDLASLTAKVDLILSPPTPADGFGGPTPGIAITETGPLDALVRDVDASSLTAWLTVRAAEQEAKKLEALEAERRAREAAEEEQKRLEAERLQRQIDADKAAAEKAAEAKAAADKAVADRAAAEKAAAEKEAADRASAEKAAADKAAAEKAAADKAAAEKAAAEKAASDAARTSDPVSPAPDVAPQTTPAAPAPPAAEPAVPAPDPATTEAPPAIMPNAAVAPPLPPVRPQQIETMPRMPSRPTSTTRRFEVPAPPVLAPPPIVPRRASAP